MEAGRCASLELSCLRSACYASVRVLHEASKHGKACGVEGAQPGSDAAHELIGPEHLQEAVAGAATLLHEQEQLLTALQQQWQGQEQGVGELGPDGAATLEASQQLVIQCLSAQLLHTQPQGHGNASMRQNTSQDGQAHMLAAQATAGGGSPSSPEAVAGLFALASAQLRSMHALQRHIVQQQWAQPALDSAKLSAGLRALNAALADVPPAALPHHTGAAVGTRGAGPNGEHLTGLQGPSCMQQQTVEHLKMEMVALGATLQVLEAQVSCLIAAQRAADGSRRSVEYEGAKGGGGDRMSFNLPPSQKGGGSGVPLRPRHRDGSPQLSPAAEGVDGGTPVGLPRCGDSSVGAALEQAHAALEDTRAALEDERTKHAAVLQALVVQPKPRAPACRHEGCAQARQVLQMAERCAALAAAHVS